MYPPSYMRSVVDRNVVMRRMTVYRKISHENSHTKGSVSVCLCCLLCVQKHDSTHSVYRV